MFYGKEISVDGPQRLSTLLAANSFPSLPYADELIIISASAFRLKGGTGTDGGQVPANTSIRMQGGTSTIDLSQIYIYTASAQNVSFFIQARG